MIATLCTSMRCSQLSILNMSLNCCIYFTLVETQIGNDIYRASISTATSKLIKRNVLNELLFKAMINRLLNLLLSLCKRYNLCENSFSQGGCESLFKFLGWIFYKN